MAIARYIKFLLKSTNQHGVHSPFVYNLVTQCFYDKTKYEAYKRLTNYATKSIKFKDVKLLYRVIKYFGFTSVLTTKSDVTLINKLNALFGNTLKIQLISNDLKKTNTYDFIYLNISKLDIALFRDILGSVHNNTVMLVNIGDDLWDEIKSNPTVKVTINVYKFQLIFFRKEQVKEHFLIRR